MSKEQREKLELIRAEAKNFETQAEADDEEQREKERQARRQRDNEALKRMEKEGKRRVKETKSGFNAVFLIVVIVAILFLLLGYPYDFFGY